MAYKHDETTITRPLIDVVQAYCVEKRNNYELSAEEKLERFLHDAARCNAWDWKLGQAMLRQPTQSFFEPLEQSAEMLMLYIASNDKSKQTKAKGEISRLSEFVHVPENTRIRGKELHTTIVALSAAIPTALLSALAHPEAASTYVLFGAAGTAVGLGVDARLDRMSTDRNTLLKNNLEEQIGGLKSAFQYKEIETLKQYVTEFKQRTNT